MNVRTLGLPYFRKITSNGRAELEMEADKVPHGVVCGKQAMAEHYLVYDSLSTAKNLLSQFMFTDAPLVYVLFCEVRHSFYTV